MKTHIKKDRVLQEIGKYQLSTVFVINAIASIYNVIINIIDGVQDLALNQFETYVIKPTNMHFNTNRMLNTFLDDHGQQVDDEGKRRPYALIQNLIDYSESQQEITILRHLNEAKANKGILYVQVPEINRGSQKRRQRSKRPQFQPESKKKG